MAETLFDFRVQTPNGKELDFSTLKGKAVLIVNTATKCGLAPQFKGIETLYQSYRDKGLAVIGFPSDQFAQEPENDEHMSETCEVNFGVTFPLMAKSYVNGSRTNAVFEFLKNKAPGLMGRAIKWNFTKFLVYPDGKTVKRFAPTVEPAKIAQAIEKALPA